MSKEIKSINQIAAEMGVTRQAVSSWFRGKSSPTMRHLNELAKVLDLEPATVLKMLSGEELSTE